VVTNGYNGRGLPYSLSGSTAGNLVTSTLYNQLAQVTEINLGNSLRTIFGYWGVGGPYDTTGGYYGRLWEIKTFKSGGSPVLQDVKHTWDAGGNLAQRQDVLAAETETFTYDFLDRLTSVSGPYSESYAYNQIGNIVTKNGVSYNYGTKPHAVTSVGSASYVYDNNGNMTARGSQTVTWDVENRPVSVTSGNVTSTFIYDGDGSRVKKTEDGQTVLYINKYYEKNVTSGNITTYYYLGGRLVAMRQGTTLTYVHQDHLTGTAVVSDSSGALVSSIKYFPYGATRSGSVPTDKQFTGQRLDGTGLYYYGARYYDAGIGRFISADTIVQSPGNPQTLNRYSYCLNNPLAYTDPTGNIVDFYVDGFSALYDLRFLMESEEFVNSQTWKGFLALFNAWNSLDEVAHNLTHELETAEGTDPFTREKSPLLFTISWGTLPGDLGECTRLTKLFVNPASWCEIHLNPSLLLEQGGVVAVLAHESFHAYNHSLSEKDNMWFTKPIDSKDQEAIANSFGFWVSWMCGTPYSGVAGYTYLNPFVDERTFRARVDVGVYQLRDKYPGLPRADGGDCCVNLDTLQQRARSVWPSGWPY
jgi:RHS repeat-associated protein